jgi:NitT/TauT family transport system permease protein
MSTITTTTAPAIPALAPAARADRTKYLPWITTPVLVIAFVAIWHFYTVFSGISPFILPKPAAVWTVWVSMLSSRSAWANTLVTIYSTLMGFGFGLVIGVVLGLVIGRIRWLEATLNPFVIATQVIPKVALIPLFVVWFGFGMTPKVIVAAVLSFFPILTNTVLGVKSVEAGHRDVMTSINASRLATFIHLDLRNALPYILTGMEVGIVLAIIGTIVGEYLGGSAGLGFMLVSEMNSYQTDGLFAVIIHMTIIGFVFYFATGALRRFLIPWHQSAE